MVGLGWLFVLVTIRERINSANWVDGEANKHIQTHLDTHRLAAPLSSEMPQRQKGHKCRHCHRFPSTVALSPCPHMTAIFRIPVFQPQAFSTSADLSFLYLSPFPSFSLVLFLATIVRLVLKRILILFSWLSGCASARILHLTSTATSAMTTAWSHKIL